MSNAKGEGIFDQIIVVCEGPTAIERWAKVKQDWLEQIFETLDQINVQGAIVTIDAMGCQKDIAQKIVDGGGNLPLQSGLSPFACK